MATEKKDYQGQGHQFQSLRPNQDQNLTSSLTQQTTNDVTRDWRPHRN